MSSGSGSTRCKPSSSNLTATATNKSTRPNFSVRSPRSAWIMRSRWLILCLTAMMPTAVGPLTTTSLSATRCATR